MLTCTDLLHSEMQESMTSAQVVSVSLYGIHIRRRRVTDCVPAFAGRNLSTENIEISDTLTSTAKRHSEGMI